MTGAPKTRTSSKEVVAKQEADALELVSEAMTSVCTETVRDAEVGIKSETDAMKLANSVAPICQKKAEKQFGCSGCSNTFDKGVVPTARWAIDDCIGNRLLLCSL